MRVWWLIECRFFLSLLSDVIRECAVNLPLFVLCRAHWYLAVICYPALTAPEIGFRNSEESFGDICEINSKKSKSNGKAENPKKSEVSIDA